MFDRWTWLQSCGVKEQPEGCNMHRVCRDSVENVDHHNHTELQKYYAVEEDFLWMASMYEL